MAGFTPESLADFTPELVADFVRNNHLQNLTGLESVNFAGDMYIYENDSLTSLTGFGNESTIIDDLYICDNPLLSTCDVPSICNYLGNPARVEIRDNSVGCNSLEEVNDSCEVIPANQELEMIGFTMYPNPANRNLLWERENPACIRTGSNEYDPPRHRVAKPLQTKLTHPEHPRHSGKRPLRCDSGKSTIWGKREEPDTAELSRAKQRYRIALSSTLYEES